jgi:hypothetical protein
LEDFRKNPKSKNLEKHIQILVREFKTAKQKTEKRKERQDRKKREEVYMDRSPLARPIVQPNRGLAWIPFWYSTDKRDPPGGIHRLPPFGGSSSLSSAGESPTPRSAPPPLTPYKTMTATVGTLAPSLFLSFVLFLCKP